MAQLLERLSTGLNEIVKLVCVIIAVVLTVTIFIGVISRYILGKPFIWEYEFSIMLLVWMTFLGVSIGFKERAHLALTFLVDHSPPALRKAARVLAFLATILFAIFCIVNGFGIARSFLPRTYRTIPVSLAWTYAALPTSFVVSLLHLTVHALETLGLLPAEQAPRDEAV
ncbi:MAG: TRAP transporter small permease [Firmicutes bacterium]|nr:TRAP transporter small permease [Bacillota bacterium]